MVSGPITPMYLSNVGGTRRHGRERARGANIRLKLGTQNRKPCSDTKNSVSTCQTGFCEDALVPSRRLDDRIIELCHELVAIESDSPEFHCVARELQASFQNPSSDADED